MSEKNTEIEELVKKQVKKQLKEQLKLENNSNVKYNGWLISNSLFKRSLAVLWHYFLGYMILFIPIILITIAFISLSWFIAWNNSIDNINAAKELESLNVIVE